MFNKKENYYITILTLLEIEFNIIIIKRFTKDYIVKDRVVSLKVGPYR